jgi:multimeric flavodoxin WrbA
VLYQVPELVPDNVLEKSGAKAARAAFARVPVAKPEQLADADAIIFGTPTRFGNMCAQMRNEVSGGTAYGASTITRGDGSRQPSENELAIARFQGKHVAQIAKRLASRSG